MNIDLNLLRQQYMFLKDVLAENRNFKPLTCEMLDGLEAFLSELIFDLENEKTVRIYTL